MEGSNRNDVSLSTAEQGEEQQCQDEINLVERLRVLERCVVRMMEQVSNHDA